MELDKEHIAIALLSKRKVLLMYRELFVRHMMKMLQLLEYVRLILKTVISISVTKNALWKKMNCGKIEKSRGK